MLQNKCQVVDSFEQELLWHYMAQIHIFICYFLHSWNHFIFSFPDKKMEAYNCMNFNYGFLLILPKDKLNLKHHSWSVCF